MPERVLEQLGQLGLGRTRDGDRALDEPPVEPVDVGQRRGVDPRHDLRRVDQGPRAVARIDTLGAVAEEEVLACGQTRAVLQDRADDLLGRAGVRRRLQHDGRAGPHVAGELGGRVLDVRQVGNAVLQRGGNRDHGVVEAGALSRFVGDAVQAGRQHGVEPLVAHVSDKGLPGGEEFDAKFVHVEADDLEADLGGSHRKRQSDVSLPNDDEFVHVTLLPLAVLTVCDARSDVVEAGGRLRRWSNRCWPPP